MRAVRIQAHGGPEVLRVDDVPPPEAGPGEVLLGVRAAGVNFADIERRRGSYEPHLPLPSILGAEAAGVIVAVGAGVNPALRGMRAVGLARASQAEMVKMPAAEVVLLPEVVDFDVAAALPVQGLTAYHLLHTMESVTPGMSILVHAIAGGVGLLVLQLAKAAGARVYGTASTEAKAEVARRLGADAVLVAPDDLAGEILELTGGHGVDLVLDSVGRSTAEASLRSLAPFGHLVHFGEASGPPPRLDISALYGRSLRVSAYWLRSPHPPGTHSAALHELLSDVVAGTLTCTIGLRLPLERVADAHRALEGRRTVGKVVLRVDHPP
ncbi:MAG TPA: quinone oxidoreductase [Myxococcaceae bacterium]|jgi:NADPH2:quinone reductase|nr:quinone oxidoreductase [Myxococcaceae bacterium]